jgi:hypothetical protein
MALKEKRLQIVVIYDENNSNSLLSSSPIISFSIYFHGEAPSQHTNLPKDIPSTLKWVISRSYVDCMILDYLVSALEDEFRSVSFPVLNIIKKPILVNLNIESPEKRDEYSVLISERQVEKCLALMEDWVHTLLSRYHLFSSADIKTLIDEFFMLPYHASSLYSMKNEMFKSKTVFPSGYFPFPNGLIELSKQVKYAFGRKKRTFAGEYISIILFLFLIISIYES